MNTNKPQVVLENAELIALKMTAHKIPRSTIDKVNLNHSVFKSVDIHLSGIDESSFVESEWRKCNLVDSFIADSDFTKCKMNQLDMSGAGFTRVKFVDATLKDIDFSFAIMMGVDFSEATLIRVNFSEVNFDYASMDFSNTKFIDCRMPMAVAKLLNLTDEQLDGLLDEPISV